MNLKRAIIVYNPMAGRPGRRAENVRAMTRLLEARGIRADAFATTGPEDASRIASNAVSDGVDIVISYGGDGTLNEVIQGMAGSQTALAAWPGGTANVVARDLAIPSDMTHLADVIAAGKTKRIALGLAKTGSGVEKTASGFRAPSSAFEAASTRSQIGPSNCEPRTRNPEPGTEKYEPGIRNPEPETHSERYFLMMAGIGIDASIARGVNKRLKRMIGELAYWWCGIKYIFLRRAEVFSIDVDGRRFESAFALIGKGKGYGGGMTMTPEAKLEEPWFEVFILPPLRNNFSYLRAVAACKRGTPEAAGAMLVKGTHIKANSTEEPWVEVDGEVIGPLPMSFEVVPDALSVIIP
ncbi:MAG TPA: diacylglycerol kinase family protein [Blastocatellia bacterium]|nr:diacylglycerol kinase family protein [Blastocatellia bacterium]